MARVLLPEQRRHSVLLGDLLGDERHEGVQQAHDLVQHPAGVTRDLRLPDLVLAVQRHLDELQVPVAELVPHEVVEGVHGGGEVVDAHRLLDRREAALEAARDPAVDLGGVAALRRVSLGAEQHEPGRVPQLVGEAAAHGDLLFAEAHVLGAAHEQQAEARGVGAVRVDHLERVDARTQTLAHAPAVGGLDHRMEVDVVEGDVVHELEAHHDHARDPQEDDVAPRAQHVRRIEVGQVGGLLGPAERGERPERRAEPRVQHVGLARELGGAALGTGLRLGLGHGDVAVRAVPHRQLVAPPELPADAPRPQVVHPVDVHTAPALGRELDLAVADDVRRGLLELVHVHEPLLADERLDGRAATVAGGHAVRIVLDLDQGTEGAQVRDHARGGLLDLEPGVRDRRPR